MSDKFNFYDFVSLVIPGGTVLALLYWFCIGALALDLDFSIDSLGESVVLLAASYFTGHVVQEFGHRLEERRATQSDGLPSERLMRDDNRVFSAELKQDIRACIQRTLGVVYAPSDASAELQKSRRQEIFRLCYAFVLQKDLGKQTETFNGIYGLLRGLVVSTQLGWVVSTTILVKQLLLFVLQTANVTLPSVLQPDDSFWKPSGYQLFLSIVMLALFILARGQIVNRLDRFAVYFAASVYRNFYTWCKSQPSGGS